MTLTMPVEQVAKGGVDIFLHVMENYITHEGGAPMADAIREESREAIRALHARGIEVAMLTGDNAHTAARMAADRPSDRTASPTTSGIWIMAFIRNGLVR